MTSKHDQPEACKSIIRWRLLGSFWVGGTTFRAYLPVTYVPVVKGGHKGKGRA